MKKWVQERKIQVDLRKLSLDKDGNGKKRK